MYVIVSENASGINYFVKLDNSKCHFDKMIISQPVSSVTKSTTRDYIDLRSMCFST